MARDSDGDAEYYGTGASGVEGALQSQLARTPWWMISIAVHAMVGLMLVFIVTEVAPPVAPMDVAIAVEEPDENPIDEEEIKAEEEEVERDTQIEEAPIEDPVIKDAEVADHNETDDNEEFQQSKGEENAVSDKPFHGQGWNDAIGVGGGAGGTFGGRFGGKADLVARGSGSRATERAVGAGLEWLAHHQDPDGSWSCDNFCRNCRKNICDGKGGSAEYTPGTTGLALLAFLGAGNSIRYGTYKEHVKRGARYLKGIQTPDGCIGPKTADGHYVYNHAICTMALAEAYGLSDSSPLLKGPAQQAVDFLMSCQNPYLGWRYGIRPGDNDTSITGWAVLALKSAKISKLNVPPEGFAGARNWFDKVTDESFFKTGYTQKGDNGARQSDSQRYQPTEAMTAAALACRIFMGGEGSEPAIRSAALLLKNQPPRWEPETGNDFYYWYYGTLAMFQMGGEYWKTWNAGMKDALVKSQRRGGDENGSWDPCDAWGSAGGRVYSTAINTLSLEIYYRYDHVLGAKRANAEAAGH